ncbi:MAG: 16S rRNA (cytidine(1402)-2'-O)-methyltransferase [Candidatus Omnitrophica bacterium]|nr:16S rRNA (cytidine(1402)-2'-O)-methyltransferase [Candidatus Omnitrophota bacterium]
MLYVVATPIGNLKDITLRALEALKGADAVLSEDTRRTRILLAHHGIEKPLIAYHEHTSPAKIQDLVTSLEAGKTFALVSDGGMPLISDPGYPLVREMIRKNLPFEVLPGPNAALTALAASGLAVDQFSFFGFLSAKSAARKKELGKLKDREETLIFYESPYRLLRALGDIREVLGDREAAVAREMTKKFQEFARGRLSDIINHFEKKKVLGEFVIVVSGKDRKKVLEPQVSSY